MWRCPDCKTPNNDSDNFCANCGSPRKESGNNRILIFAIVSAMILLILIAVTIVLLLVGRGDSSTEKTPAVTPQVIYVTPVPAPAAVTPVVTPAPTPVPTSTVCNHQWLKPTCSEPQICSKCGLANGSALGHDWVAATYTKPMTCLRCGVTVGEKLKNNDSGTNKNETYYESGVACYGYPEALRLFPGITDNICVPVNIKLVEPYNTYIAKYSYRRVSFHFYNDGEIHYYSITPEYNIEATVHGYFSDPDSGIRSYLVSDEVGYYWATKNVFCDAP